MSTIAFDQFALTRIADFARSLSRLHQASRTGDRRSLREISIALAKAGHVNFNGQPFNPASVKAMIDGPLPADPTTGD